MRLAKWYPFIALLLSVVLMGCVCTTESDVLHRGRSTHNYPARLAAVTPPHAQDLEIVITGIWSTGPVDLSITNHSSEEFSIGTLQASDLNVFFAFYDEDGTLKSVVPNASTLDSWGPAALRPQETTDFRFTAPEMFREARHVLACWSHNPGGTPLHEPVVSSVYPNPWWWPTELGDVDAPGEGAGIQLRLEQRTADRLHVKIINNSSSPFVCSDLLLAETNVSVAFYDQHGRFLVSKPTRGFVNAMSSQILMQPGAIRANDLWLSQIPHEARHVVARWVFNKGGTPLPHPVSSNALRLSAD